MYKMKSSSKKKSIINFGKYVIKYYNTAARD